MLCEWMNDGFFDFLRSGLCLAVGHCFRGVLPSYWQFPSG